MKFSQKQTHLIQDLTSVLKRYGEDEYNPQVVIEVLSRAMRRGQTGKRHLRMTSVLPFPEAKAHEIVQEQRKRLGFSMQELARRSGIAQPNLSAIVNGKRAIGLAVAKKLGNALKVSYRALL